MTDALAVPRNRGDVADWLANEGYPARTPPIRSSDLDLLSSDRFLYYLSRRLGLVSALRYSKALSRGSWFHTRCEAFKSPNPREFMVGRYTKREEELRRIGRALGLGDSTISDLLEREKKDLNCAWGWFDAASQLKCIIPPGVPGAVRQTLAEYTGPLTLLDAEPRLVSSYRDSLVVAQPDAIAINPAGVIWIIDFKTCEESPKVRLETCPVEFQSRHYLAIAKAILPGIIAHYHLDPGATLGGIIHICVQKPTIDFGQNDRNFQTREKIITRGKNVGEVRIEKEYEGEPRLENYIERCGRWYRGDAEYLDKKPEREAAPPVAVSYTNVSIMTPDFWTEYEDQIDFIRHFQKCAPEPSNFFRTRNGMVTYGGKLSDYAPLFVSHPTQWIELISKQRLMAVDRDPDLTPNSRAGVYPRIT